MRFTLRTTVLRRLLGLLVALNLLYFGTHAVLVLYATDVVGGGNSLYAGLLTATAFGAIAGQRIVGRLTRRVGNVAAVTAGVWLWTVGMIGLAVASRPEVAIGSCLVIGAGTGIWNVVTVSIRQTITPNRLMGRVNMAYRAVAQGVICIGAALSGVIAERFSVRTPFAVAAAGFVVLAVASPLVLRPARRSGASYW